MNVRKRVGVILRYNALTAPIIFALYVPYQLLFIGLTGIQFLKWILTALEVSFVANTILSLWVSFCYKRKWLK